MKQKHAINYIYLSFGDICFINTRLICRCGILRKIKRSRKKNSGNFGEILEFFFRERLIFREI